jgi:hypothetical protein
MTKVSGYDRNNRSNNRFFFEVSGSGHDGLVDYRRVFREQEKENKAYPGRFLWARPESLLYDVYFYSSSTSWAFQRNGQ